MANESKNPAAMAAADGFKYDVAFSFLGNDETLAASLNGLLRGRVSTFLYSDAERQRVLAGRDGETVFNRVFGEEARIVVVLYRTGWGDSGFTAVEATAIRNRAFEHGYDFVTFVPLEKPATVPRWVPRARIWIGLERWGLERAASVIESRVEECGGTPREETAEEAIERVKGVLRTKRERESFLTSEQGVGAARAAFRELFDRFRSIAEGGSGLITDAEMSNDGRLCAVQGGLQDHHRPQPAIFELAERF